MNVPDQVTQASIDQPSRSCDFCNESKALLYCRADSAKLCLSCDREVHATNQLFRKHVRSLLCNSCGSSPSSIFCCTESSVLCQNCDWEAHSRFGSIHDRRPVEGFNGCPSVSELLSLLGLDDLGKKDLVSGDDDEFLDLLVWETPSIVSVDDLIAASDCVDDDGRGFQAMGVPPLPKNRNSACGKHKEEIFRQLREMAKNDPNFSGSLDDLEPYIGLQLMDNCPGLESKAEPTSVPSYESNTPNWSSFTGGALDESFPSTFVSSFVEMHHLVPDKDLDVGENTSLENGFQAVQSHEPLDSKPSQLLPKAGVRELNSQERDSAISRYKEKKKTRRYDKHIRYESRKARAETRTRIKGRFAKIGH